MSAAPRTRRSPRGPSEPGIRASLRHETLTRFVAEVAARQYGVISLAQAIAMGMSASAIQRRVASGAWEMVLPGVYRVRGAPVTRRQQMMAAVLWAGSGASVSHGTAAILWKLEGLSSDEIEVTVPRARRKRCGRVVVHRALVLPEADRDEVDGIPCTAAARTLIDVAGSLDDEQLEVVMESGFHRGLYRESFLRWRLNELGGTGRRGSGRLLALLDDRGKGAAPLESPLEAKMWRLLKKSGLTRPVRQHWVRAGGHRHRLDFAWPDLMVAIECDGYDTHGGATAFRRDRAKLAEVGAAGWRVIPVTWHDVARRPQWVIEQVRIALSDAA